MKRLDFNLEGRIIDFANELRVKARVLHVPPEVIGIDTSGIGNSDSLDPEFIKRIDQAITQKQEAKLLPYKANAYIPSRSKVAGPTTNYVWVAVQFYKTY